MEYTEDVTQLSTAVAIDLAEEPRLALERYRAVYEDKRGENGYYPGEERG